MSRGRYLKAIHPRAIALLAKYGKDYTPKVWRRPPSFGEPQANACFGNAWMFMRLVNKHNRKRKASGQKPLTKESVVYVEGLCMGPLVDPMLHAWNAGGFRHKVAVDWSHYAGAHLCRYFGIALSEREHERTRRLCRMRENYPHSIFDRKYFPKVEKYLKGVLTRRAQCMKRKKKSTKK